MNEVIYLKGRESFTTGLLLLLVIILFILPITGILILRYLYRTIRSIVEYSKLPEPVNDILERI
jgi:hypothetical protein